MAGFVEVQGGVLETFCDVVAAERAEQNDEGKSRQNYGFCAMIGVELFHDVQMF
jgi:hypothetical protein